MREIRRGFILFAFGISMLLGQERSVTIQVDASKPWLRLIHASLKMPVQPGPLTLLYPKWIPGDHQPVGPISDLAGLKISAGGKAIAWARDPIEMWAFRVDIPPGTASIDIEMDLIVAPEAVGPDSSTAATSEMMIFNWGSVLLYPKGGSTDAISYQATLTVPGGWRYGTALPVARESGQTIEFKPCSLTTLVDSPLIAGRHFQTVDLDPGGSVPEFAHVAGDSAAAVDVPKELESSWRRLVKEEEAVFGPGHFRSYHFLVSLSDHIQSYAGLEHHESSDNRFVERALLTEGARRYIGDVLPHEMAHSWNGKYRRPAGLATSDYSEPMQGDLLWVYEGLTDYYGRVLAARSGVRSAEDFRDELAMFADRYSNESGRAWRPLEDTAVAVQNTFFARSDYADFRRGADYYNESTLIWLEADVLIRKLSNGTKSLDDFCRLFASGPAGMPAVKAYNFEDVVSTLNSVQPYDWRGFLEARVQRINTRAPVGGIEQSGWRLTYTAAEPELTKFKESYVKENDFMASIGLAVKEDGTISDVRITSKAYAAGMAPSTKLIAVNGRQYTLDVFREALQAAKNRAEPIELLIKDGEYYTTHGVDYHAGERYPHLERESTEPDILSGIVKPRTN
jgi:predicted metalloprotease with PDZ domain